MASSTTSELRIGDAERDAAAERLRGFGRPVLLAWAREDRFFPVKLAERLLERLPDGRLELIDDSYTFVPIDQPEQLAELIGEFVRDAHAAAAR